MAYIGTVPIPQSNEVRQEFLIDTASQSTFFTRTNYVPQFIDVYKNGLRLQTADFTATNGYTVTLATPAVLNDVVAIEYRISLQFNTNNQLQLNPGGSTVIDSQGFDVLYEDTGGAVTLTADEMNVGSNALVVNSSGNVGIGTSSLAYKLETKDSDIAVVKLTSASGGNTVNGIRFRVNNSSNTAQSATLGMVNAETVSGWGGTLTFSTKPANGIPSESVTERMRIDSSGRVQINREAKGSDLAGAELSIYSTDNYTFTSERSGTSDVPHIRFRNDNGTVGSINTNGFSTQYNSSSDYRLKENITEITDGITRVKQLNPSRFNFIADPNTTVDGFIAHEVQPIVLEAVSGEKDAVNEDGSINPQGLDLSKLVPLLTAALQESIAKIENLETRIAQLESK